MAFTLDGSSILRHDTIAHRKTQPCALPHLLGSEEGIKDSGQEFLLDAATRIGNQHLSPAGFLSVTGDNPQLPLAVHRMQRVADQIKKHLLQTFGINPDEVQSLLARSDQFDVVHAECVLDDGENGLNAGVHVAVCFGLLAHPGKVEQPLNNALAVQAVPLDGLEIVIFHRARFHSFQEQLAESHHDPEGVVDLVRHAGGQDAQGCQLLRVDQLLFQAFPFRDIAAYGKNVVLAACFIP